MKIDPTSEVNYRCKLALEYLKKAEKFLNTGDYKESVEASQLSIESAAKAIIALKRIPSWTHDPSSELIEVMHELSLEQKNFIEELAYLAHELAPEHGIATYGKPTEGITPWELYNEEKAYKALKKAKRANELVDAILKNIEFNFSK
ncbi:HEPN domain-containing protein [Candidatus Bathyarchaeota archaeon]|nr:HEPN domain-containing protein [Candidatus Bathyarchaeota archaeon]